MRSGGPGRAAPTPCCRHHTATARLPLPPQDCFSDQDICVQGLLPCVLFGENAAKLGVLQDDNPCGQFCCMCTGACECTQHAAIMHICAAAQILTVHVADVSARSGCGGCCRPGQ